MKSFASIGHERIYRLPQYFASVSSEDMRFQSLDGNIFWALNDLLMSARRDGRSGPSESCLGAVRVDVVIGLSLVSAQRAVVPSRCSEIAKLEEVERPTLREGKLRRGILRLTDFCDKAAKGRERVCQT